MTVTKIRQWIQEPVSIAPLANFRVLFGIMMVLSTIRFWMKGWVMTQYVDPAFHFTFMGFDWVQPLGATGMYAVFLIMGISALLVALGLYYRISIIVFFLLFSYVELIDVTYYLNHYYFVSVISFLMIWLPAGRFFSLDVWRNPAIEVTLVPRWITGTIRLQLGLVYFFAGLAKLNADWLFEAMPMKIWLPTKSHLPLIGNLMYEDWVAYLFSWFGAIYDLFIVFFLLNKRTRKYGYIAVLIFHIATAIFFPAIGMFPYIMMVCTLIFFSAADQLKLIYVVRDFSELIWYKISGRTAVAFKALQDKSYQSAHQKLMLRFLMVFFFFQLILPLRYLAYPGPLFWTEEGYRFSWRVMLMEKVGTANFYVREAKTGKTYEVNNREFLSTQQEKMMSTQADLILRYAHYLAKVYAARGIIDPEVYGESYVTLNGSRSAPFIDPQVNLAVQPLSFKHYQWILPFNSTP
ncbi:HTTM domain-containing protein [Pedobacter gandavensis]|uniref:HTTM domain-containing protein n=1 Tax=Pedobacter gandavensis TaxID=2679963 RepID=UPI00292D8280|nr:HTTM domain-containing protein [Pedobacter gandavensis]